MVETAKTPRFDFVTGDDFRASLESDYRELQNCVESRAWKAVYVLAGSIVEAVLIDYLVAWSDKPKNLDPLKAKLADVIEACQQHGIITTQTSQLLHVVRQYRNLIHPGRSIRLGQTPDENGAMVAAAVVEMVLAEVAKRQQATYGYTAEQIVRKVENDATAISILGHLLKAAKPRELERLLVSVLPDRYLAIPGASWDGVDTFTAFRRCYREAFRMVPAEAKRRVVAHYVHVLREESGGMVQTYESAFFRGSDLAHADASEVRMIKEHLLSRLERDGLSELEETLEGICPYLNEGEGTNYLDGLLKAILSGSPSSRQTARQLFLSGYWSFPEKSRVAVDARIVQWEEHLMKSNDTKGFEQLRSLKEAIEPDIPF